MIKKRYCPKGHDKLVVGVKKDNNRCMTCYHLQQSNGWQNPKNAIRQMIRRLNNRIKVKRQKIADLERELGIAS